MSSKDFLQTESAESSELQGRVGQLGLRWDTAQGAVESWREGLRQSLLQCQVRRLPGPTWGGRSQYFYRWAALAQIWLM